MPGSAPNPSILSHVSLGTNQFEKAVAFYDQVLGALGIQRFLDLSAEVPAVAFGRAYPEFWIQAPCDGKPAETANGVHVAFYAATTDEVTLSTVRHWPPGRRMTARRASGRTMVSSITAASCAIWTGTRSRRWPGWSRRRAELTEGRLRDHALADPSVIRLTR